jgi:hypothetical protein
VKDREVNNSLTFPLAILGLVVVACACPFTGNKRQSSSTSDSNTGASSSPASATEAPRSTRVEPPAPSSDTQTDTTPSFLLQGWIQPIASNVERTYDFTGVQAAGRRTVIIQSWQQIGMLGWQSNQTYPGMYKADEGEISISSPTGYNEHWRIVERHSDHIVVEDDNGNSVTWFNCTANVWPDLIRASTHGCD